MVRNRDVFLGGGREYEEVPRRGECTLMVYVIRNRDSEVGWLVKICSWKDSYRGREGRKAAWEVLRP